MKAVIKEHSPHRNTLIFANQDDLFQMKLRNVKAKEKNIIFSYPKLEISASSKQQSPSKKMKNHILDRLLGKW